MVMQMNIYSFTHNSLNEKRILTFQRSLVINFNTMKIHELYREHIGEGKYVTFTEYILGWQLLFCIAA